jgi:glycosyltransferase involved in cell wall biosynthesis
VKICHVIAGISDRSGGPTGVVLGLTRALAGNGVRVTVITTNQEIGGTVRPEEVRRKWTIPSVELQCHPIVGSWRYAYASGLRDTLDKAASCSDLFHLHGFWVYPVSIAASVARRQGLPYLYTAHGMLNTWAMKKSYWRKRLLLALWEGQNIRRSGAVHFFNAAEEISPDVERLLPHKVFIPNGVDPDSLEPAPPLGLFKSQFGLHGKSVVLFLGRLHPVKGIDRLIEAFREVAKKQRDAALVIAGPDAAGYRSILEKMISKNGLSDRIILPGMLTGMAKRAVLADSDLLVLPSYQEGHSMAVTEALYYGLPVIISKACHMPEVELHNAGVIVEGEPGQLSKSIVELITDSEKRKTMGDAGRLLARRLYTWEGIAGDMVKVYEDLLRAKNRNRHDLLIEP